VSSTSSAAREPGEATTRALSVAYGLRSDAALLCIFDALSTEGLRRAAHNNRE